MEIIRKLLKGYLLAAVFFILLTVITTLLLKFTSLPESANWICLIAAMSAACTFLGIFTGNLFGKRGLLYGLLFSVVFLFLVIFLTLLCFSGQFSTALFGWEYGIPLLLGAIGGIVGTNLKN